MPVFHAFSPREEHTMASIGLATPQPRQDCAKSEPEAFRVWIDQSPGTPMTEGLVYRHFGQLVPKPLAACQLVNDKDDVTRICCRAMGPVSKSGRERLLPANVRRVHLAVLDHLRVLPLVP